MKIVGERLCKLRIQFKNLKFVMNTLLDYVSKIFLPLGGHLALFYEDHSKSRHAHCRKIYLRYEMPNEEQ